MHARDIEIDEPGSDSTSPANAPLSEAQTFRIAETEVRLTSVAGELFDGLLTLDEQGRIRTFNQRACQIFGYAEHEVRDRDIWQLFGEPHSSVLEGFFARTERPLDIGIDIEREVTARRKSGESLPIELSISHVRAGAETVYVGTVRDLSALRKVQREASELALIVHRTSNMVFVLNREIRIDWANRGFEAITGYSLDEVRGKFPSEVLFGPDDVQAERVCDAIRKREAFKADFLCYHKNGRQYWIECDADPILDDAGELVKYIGIGVDITERKRTDQMKADFVSMVSHELRTPLTVVSGALDVIAEGMAGEVSDDVAELVEMARTNCGRLARLIEDLLDVNRIEAGVLPFNGERLLLAEVLRGAIDGIEALAHEAGSIVRIQKLDPLAVVFADRGRLIQVLHNLVSNAVKFSPPGSLVAIRCERREGWARVSVADEGPGISEAFRPKIFKKFSREDSAEASGKEGFGLGLCICKGLIERMGGRIDFESELGRGSTFFFELPLIDSATGAPYRPIAGLASVPEAEPVADHASPPG